MKVVYKTWKICLRYRPSGASDFSWGQYYDVMLEAWGKMEYSREFIQDIIGKSPDGLTEKEVEKLIKEAEAMPKWYGFAYRDFNRDVRVAYPIPINIIVAWFRYFNLKIRFEWPRIFDAGDWHLTLKKGFKEGFNAGHFEGYAAACKLHAKFLPEGGSDELKDTVIANSYKNVFGFPESELLISFELKKPIIKKPTTKEVTQFAVKYEPMFSKEEIDSLKASYETPVNEWTLVGSAEVPLDKSMFTFESATQELAYINSQVKEKQDKDKLEKQIIKFIDQLCSNELDATKLKAKLAAFEAAIKEDTGMTIAQLLKKHKHDT
jgi:hypothetical protein